MLYKPGSVILRGEGIRFYKKKAGVKSGTWKKRVPPEPSGPEGVALRGGNMLLRMGTYQAVDKKAKCPSPFTGAMDCGKTLMETESIENSTQEIIDTFD